MTTCKGFWLRSYILGYVMCGPRGIDGWGIEEYNKEFGETYRNLDKEDLGKEGYNLVFEIAVSRRKGKTFFTVNLDKNYTEVDDPKIREFINEALRVYHPSKDPEKLWGGEEQPDFIIKTYKDYSDESLLRDVTWTIRADITWNYPEWIGWGGEPCL